ncbi:MAG: hypothetical protein ACFFDN_45900 [Candidatus Hodarchaeota archaeon]
MNVTYGLDLMKECPSCNKMVSNLKKHLKKEHLEEYQIRFGNKFKLEGIDTSDISPKLAYYLKKIMIKSDRPIKISKVYDHSISGMKASFCFNDKDHSKINIEINPTISFKSSEGEHSLAHEATHGFLIYARGYYAPVKFQLLRKVDGDSIGLIGGMIDDIVVNCILQNEGFPVISEFYFPMVNDEIHTTDIGRDVYQEFSYDLTFKFRFIMYRIVYSWGIQNFIKITDEQRKILEKFRNIYEKKYPKHIEMADKICQLIQENDIFTPEGHKNVFQGVLNLWKLDHLVGLKSYKT